MPPRVPLFTWLTSRSIQWTSSDSEPTAMLS